MIDIVKVRAEQVKVSTITDPADLIGKSPKFMVKAGLPVQETDVVQIRMVEVPVNYRGRVGESKITGSLTTTLRVGTRMIALILGYWAKRRFGVGVVAPLPVAPARAVRTLR